MGLKGRGLVFQPPWLTPWRKQNISGTIYLLGFATRWQMQCEIPYTGQWLVWGSYSSLRRTLFTGNLPVILTNFLPAVELISSACTWLMQLMSCTCLWTYFDFARPAWWKIQITPLTSCSLKTLIVLQEDLDVMILLENSNLKHCNLNNIWNTVE